MLLCILFHHLWVNFNGYYYQFITLLSLFFVWAVLIIPSNICLFFVFKTSPGGYKLVDSSHLCCIQIAECEITAWQRIFTFVHTKMSDKLKAKAVGKLLVYINTMSRQLHLGLCKLYHVLTSISPCFKSYFAHWNCYTAYDTVKEMPYKYNKSHNPSDDCDHHAFV